MIVCFPCSFALSDHVLVSPVGLLQKLEEEKGKKEKERLELERERRERDKERERERERRDREKEKEREREKEKERDRERERERDREREKTKERERSRDISEARSKSGSVSDDVKLGSYSLLGLCLVHHCAERPRGFRICSMPWSPIFFCPVLFLHVTAFETVHISFIIFTHLFSCCTVPYKKVYKWIKKIHCPAKKKVAAT